MRILIYLIVAFCVITMGGCLKDTASPSRRNHSGPPLNTGEGQAVFWLTTAGTSNNVDQTYNNGLAIYLANGTEHIAKQTYSVKCGGSTSPGCNSEYGKVFNLPAGNYYAIIDYSNNPNHQTPVFTVAAGGCVPFR